jgi:hypothetical protein
VRILRNISTYILVTNQKMPLLSRRACDELKLLKVDEEKCHIRSVNINAKLFSGLGKVGRERSIKAVPHAIYVPRSISFPLRGKTDRALDEMVAVGVIKKVGPNRPTSWCASMGVVLEADKEKIKIAPDFAELKFIQREIHPLASVEVSLAMLDGGTVFSKIDVNRRLCQIPLFFGLDDTKEKGKLMRESDEKLSFNFVNKS